MKNRFPLVLVASAALFGGMSLASAAEPDATGSVSVTSEAGPTTSAIPSAAVATVRPAMAEVFHPAPLPDEDRSGPTRHVADAGPNLHPDFLGVHEKADGPLGDTDLAYNRNERMKPAGGMSLQIPMQ